MTTLEGSPVAPPGRLAAFLRPRVGGFPRTFWTLWAGTLLNRLGTMVEPFLGLYLTTVRGLSLAQAGLVMAVLGAGSLGGTLLGGVLADRIGRRATLTCATVGTGAAMLILGYAQGIAAIVAAALLLGVLLDMYRPAAQAMVADIISPADRPRAFGLLFWAINLGWAVAMVLGGTLAQQGFLWLFWIDALTCASFGLLVWRAIPETRVRDGRAAAGMFAGFGRVLRDRVMVGYVLTSLVYTFVLMQGLTTMPLAMREDGLGPQDYGIAFAANGVLIIIVQPLVNAWLARRDHSLVLACGFVGVGIGYGLTSLASSTAGYTATVLVWTLGEITAASVLQAVVADLAPADLRGRYSGLYGMAWSGGFLLAPLGGTQLLGLGGAPALWLTCAGLAVAAAVAVAALGPAIRRRRAIALEVDFSSE
ncbi:MDR family MFS transporter [Actinomadura decatromicini]|uniref:MFS transporter n=1 Tax=Actinomadura decatromicini TaxID=2604572 RepID=A0A5D3FGN7_9ACTN|nr:MFS transporter [Actinomadura decatromicini]TYK48047.1 MFS transporter [Actinomadura decatromicini]